MKKGWVTRKLGDIATKIGSGATPKGGEAAYKSNGLSLIRSLNVYDDGFRPAKLAKIDDDQARKLSNVVVEPNDILLNITGASVARCCLAPPEYLPARVNQHVSIIRVPPGTVLPTYLQYQLTSPSYKKRLLQTGDEGGSTRQAITKAQIQGFEIQYPESLSEQERIVAFLDEAFAGIATAKAHAERNLQNARALFESHLNAVFTQGSQSAAEGRGEGWVETTIGTEIDLLPGFAFKSTEYSKSDDDVRLLRGDNIIQGCLRWDDAKRWPKDSIGTYERFQLNEGDVVLAMDRPWVNAGLKHAMIEPKDLPCLLVQRVARLRGGRNIDSRFLKYLIGSETFVSHILGAQTGIGVPHISGKQISDFSFHKPPIELVSAVFSAM